MGKYTYEEVKRDFKKMGYKLLTKHDEYKNVNQKLKYVCPIHGLQETTYAHIREGKGCSLCGRERTIKSRKKPDDYYKKLAEEKGFIFVGIVNLKGKRHAEVICPSHKEMGSQFIVLANLKRNKGCKYCAGNAKLSDDEKHKRFVDKVYSIFGDRITVIGKYIDQKKKIKCRCNIHNEIFDTYPNNLSKGNNGCKSCISDALSKRNLKSHEEFEEQVKLMNPHIKLLEKYNGAKGSLKCYCTIHNKEFTKYFQRLITSHTGCDECYKEDIRERMGKSTERFKEELKVVHPELEVIGKYVNRYTPIEFYCHDHNYRFYDIPSHVLNRYNCCAKSSKFIKELEVGSILDELKIKYTPQKSFYECRDVNALPFDYYLNDYHILIEYQGEQHYKVVKFGTQDLDEAKQKFEYTKKHDEIKKQYCKNNDIPLIEIPYWEYDNMKSFLIDKLKEYNVPV